MVEQITQLKLSTIVKNPYQPRLVFDADKLKELATNNREYKNSVPDAEVIEKINKLYDLGNKVVLYTSRGMVSCDGDIEKAIEKNESILKEWLKENL